MSQQQSDNFQLNAPKPLDNRTSGDIVGGIQMPYASIAVALADAKLTLLARYPGMTFYAYLSGVLTEYWWRDNLTDAGCIPKSTGGSTGLTFNILRTAEYSTTSGGYSVTMPELIGADLTYCDVIVSGRVYYGSTSSPSASRAQVNNATGLVTFLYPFSDGDTVWSNYKTGGSITPPTPGNNSYADSYVEDGYVN